MASATFSQSSILAYGGPNPGKSTTSGVIQGGFGLDVKVWRKLSIRGEVRDFWSGEPDFPLADTGKSRSTIILWRAERSGGSSGFRLATARRQFYFFV